MSTLSIETLTASDLQETLAQVWLAYLNPEQPPYPAEGIDDATLAAAWEHSVVVVQASASIRGAWEGTASVTVPLVLAAAIAEGLFETPPLDVSEGLDRDAMGLIEDALGEVVNIVAGNLKSLLPQPSALSLPEVSFVQARAASVQPLLSDLSDTHDAADDMGDMGDMENTGRLSVTLVAADHPLQVDLLAGLPQ